MSGLIALGLISETESPCLYSGWQLSSLPQSPPFSIVLHLAYISQFCYLPVIGRYLDWWHQLWNDSRHFMIPSKAFLTRWGRYKHTPHNRNHFRLFLQTEDIKTLSRQKERQILTEPQLDLESDLWFSSNAQLPCPHCKTRNEKYGNVRLYEVPTQFQDSQLACWETWK